MPQDRAGHRPGKVALLEAIDETGSITSSAKRLGMSYRRAWLLVEETNRCLVRPAVQTASGASAAAARR
jgi:molybdate transport system regulatory protein